MNIIKFGGSIVNPDGKYDNKVISEFIELVRSSNDSFIFVVGGGKICRKVQDAAKPFLIEALNEDKEVGRANDWVGIATTNINGEYDLTVTANGTNFEREKVSSFWVEEYPDLVVKDVNIQNINGKTVVLGFTIENAGESFAENVYWMIDTNSSDENPKRTNPISLGPRDFTKAFMTLEYSVLGNYNPVIIVDFDNYVHESNEFNNKQSISVNL